MSDTNSEKLQKRVEVPPFLCEMLEKQYGAEWEMIQAGFARKRHVTLRANTLKTYAAAVAEEFERNQICFERVAWYDDAFILESATEREIQALPVYERGEVYMQSLSSMLPPLLLKPQAGETILDMTAAPGGKTTQIAALSGGKALITACEKDKIRFERLKFNLERQGAARVNAMQTDASRLDDFFRFDKILLDAPCSGSGTLTANEPVRVTEKLLAGCMKSQEMLLAKALKLLKKGGTLVYSTCSLLKQENEELLKKVLPKTGAKIIPINELFLKNLPLLKSEEGSFTVCPNEYFEGFFLALIQK